MNQDGSYPDRSESLPAPVFSSTPPSQGSVRAAGARPNGWSVERPSSGLVIAAGGAVLAITGIFGLDWAAHTGFFDIRRTVDGDRASFGVVTQVYTVYLFVPLALATVVVGVLASVGRTAARVATATAGILGGLGLAGVVVWIELGGLGTSDSRRDALVVLVLMAAAGILCAALGAAVIFDDRGMLARGLAVLVAAVAAVLHLYVVGDLAGRPTDLALGAWVSAIGFALLAVAPVVPYRRIRHA
jgi:hypothetical protein